MIQKTDAEAAPHAEPGNTASARRAGRTGAWSFRRGHPFPRPPERFLMLYGRRRFRKNLQMP